jgi:hypothetical protein
MSKPWETYRAGRTVKLRRRPVRYHAAKPLQTTAAPAPEAIEAADEDYSTLTKAELVQLAEERGLDSSGTKADILGRLGY